MTSNGSVFISFGVIILLLQGLLSCSTVPAKQTTTPSVVTNSIPPAIVNTTSNIALHTDDDVKSKESTTKIFTSDSSTNPKNANTTTSR